MTKVAIIYGGGGSEHEVSLSSTKNVLENIDRDLFDVLEVLVDKDRKYQINDTLYDEQDGLNELKNRGIEVVFPIIHGNYGEDGELQSKLVSVGLHFVGSGSQTSAITIDKNKTNEELSKNNIRIPRSKIITKEDYELDLSFPIIVKPVDEGSSIHLYKFENKDDYLQSLDEIFKNKPQMLVQEFVKGREFTCGVIEKDGEVIPLVATEIILTKGDLFDYTAKYTPAGCKEVTPAEVDSGTMEHIQQLAVSCHKILGCKSISRTDIILKGDELFVLEINTIPGMTKTSFIPAQAAACGYSMKELITLLIASVS